jgi:hypothetical protein
VKAILEEADAKKCKTPRGWDSIVLGSQKARDIHRETATKLGRRDNEVHDTIDT